MAVTAKAFQLWRSRIAPQDTVSDVCRVAGIKRSTLAQQLVRDAEHMVGKIAGKHRPQVQVQSLA